MFDLIGRQPAMGRAFTAADDVQGAPPVVLLGHRLWQSRYGGDAGAIGRTVRVNGRKATIVGIMPPGFAFPQSSEIWQPLSALTDAQRGSRTSRGPGAVARLRPGVSREQALADLAAVTSDLSARFPATNTGVTPLVRDFRDRNVGRIRVVFMAFGLAVVFVLLIACANVANLLLARGLDRGREMSIRLSMGATRARLVRQLLVESAILGGCAGVLGLLVSIAGVASFQRALASTGDVPYWIDFRCDWRVLAFPRRPQPDGVDAVRPDAGPPGVTGSAGRDACRLGARVDAGPSRPPVARRARDRAGGARDRAPHGGRPHCSRPPRRGPVNSGSIATT
jgi:hypothetical protein